MYRSTSSIFQLTPSKFSRAYSSRYALTGFIALFIAPTGLANTYSDVIDADESIEIITVSATKTEREINEVAANVTRLQGQDIDALGASNIRDMLRYEPGVSVEGNGRFGLSSFNIRGINGDRVLILLDGVPIADEFSFGPNLSSRRDFIDIESIESVEVIRGPASTLYGSDAIGGVMAFTSKQPEDILKSNQNISVRTKLGYASQANEFRGNIQVAGLRNDWQWLVNAGYRIGDETDSFSNDDIIGPQRKSSDPQDIKARNLLGKLIYDITTNQQLTLTADYGKQSIDTQLLSEQGSAFRGITTLSSVGNDESERNRVSLQYQYENNQSSLRRIALNAFQQQTNSKQHTDIMRAPLAAVSEIQDRQRDSFFEQDVIGLHIQADQQFDWLGSHYLIYGFQWEQTDSESLRTGQTIIIDSGDNVPEFSVFPARDFPISELVEMSFFIQDEISLFENTLTISPGIRYDRFELEPEQDPIFSNANPGVSITEFSESEISSKLGVVYNLNSNTNLWWQYAQGYRIPPMDDVNVGFTNFAGGYTSLPNANLKPERVYSNEIGLRASVDALDLSISAYDNRYSDFIESRTVIGFNPATNLLEFQATNIDDVSIRGVDAHVQWYLGETFSGLDDWQLRLSASTQNSENKATGQELESVLPAQSVIGIQYKTIDDPWRIELVATHTGRANSLTNGEDSSPLFTAPSYVTWDILGHYQLTDTIRLNAGVFNIADEKYWLASEVRGRDAQDNLERFTAPGRNASVNVIMSF